MNFYNGQILVCKKTSKSKKPKPTKGNYYIVHKTVQTSWGDKVVLSDKEGNEVWGAVEYMAPAIGSDTPSPEVVLGLKDSYEKFLDSIFMPIICTVTNKSYAGIEIELTNGSRHFLPKKIVRKNLIEKIPSLKINETLSIQIPIWYAKSKKIIKPSESKWKT